MPDANPNPRGWTNGTVFLDLEQVVFASYSSDTLILLLRQDSERSPQTFCIISEEDWKSLRAALMFYRSGL